MDCTIVGIMQEMDLEANATLTYLSLRLSNGRVIRASVDDQSVEAVVELHVQSKGAPRVARSQTPAVRPAPPPQEDYLEPPDPDSTPEPPGDTVHVFGGQDDAEQPRVKVSADDVLDEQEEAAVLAEGSPTVVANEEQPARPIRSNIQRLPNGKVIVPSRTVTAMTGGYPNPPNSGVDTSELTGGRDPDEDGVGSV